ncbi:protein RRP5 homolog [Amblyraja radiata]|uniref:protein RRP5 homolog n=1 Tax=Amblyraja radiata TaxID=386614 RepID=UPI0014023565|nr:protein RRP5 homolog [Amblyraja radiata]
MYSDGQLTFFSVLSSCFSLSASLSGLVEYQQVTDYSVIDNRIYQENIPKGKLVTVKVLSTDVQSGLVGLSLLPADTRNPDMLPESLGLSRKEQNEKESGTTERGKRKRRDSEREQLPSKILKRQMKQSLEGTDGGLDVYCRDEEEEESDTEFKKPSSAKATVARPQLLCLDKAWQRGHEQTVAGLAHPQAAPERGARPGGPVLQLPVAKINNGSQVRWEKVVFCSKV